MQLSKRLQAVVDFVTKGTRVADIGCDHAYLSIYMIEEELASKVIAMDVNKGPLERAKGNIRKSQLEDKIEVRLSDGLQKLESGEVDTLLISGMGGGLIQRILTGKEEVIRNVEELVLQPQSEIRELRIFLEKLGFGIVKEDMVIDDGKYYVIIKATKTKQVMEEQKEVEYRYGRLLLEGKHPILKKYLERECNNLTNILEKLEATVATNNQQRISDLKKDIMYCKEGLTYYDNL